MKVKLARIFMLAACILSASAALADEPTTTPTPSAISWKDGKTTFETALAKINWTNAVQFRYTLVNPEKDGVDTIGSFRVRRAKLKLDGWIYEKNLEVEVQINWPAADLLEDANLNWNVRGDRSFMIKAGSFKAPFGRQELTAEGFLHFVDRSIVSSEFERGRELGVQLWGEALSKKIDWRVGVFNGAGYGRVTANDNNKYQFDGRLTFTPMGDPKYAESDFESTDKPLFALAGNFDINDTRPGADGKGLKRQNFGFDGIFKFKGFSLVAEMFLGSREDVADKKVDVQALHASAGYFLIPKKLELAARFATMDMDKDHADDTRSEVGAAINYYYNKNFLKVQTDVRQLEDKSKPEGERKTLEVRSQLQFLF